MRNKKGMFFKGAAAAALGDSMGMPGVSRARPVLILTKTHTLSYGYGFSVGSGGSVDHPETHGLRCSP